MNLFLKLKANCKFKLAIWILLYSFFYHPILFGQLKFIPLLESGTMEITSHVNAGPSLIYISIKYEGIYKSIDGAQSWTKVNKGLLNINSYASTMTIGPDKSIYAIIDLKLYRFSPDQNTWIVLNYEWDYNHYNPILTCSKAGWIYIIDPMYNFLGRSVYSTDGGSIFRPISINNNISNISNFIPVSDSTNFLISGSKLFLASSNGDIKRLITNYYNPAYNLLVTSHKYIIFRTDSINAFVVFDSLGKYFSTIAPFPFYQPYIFPFLQNDQGHLLGFYPDADYKSINLGKSWTKLNSNYGKYNHNHSLRPNFIYNSDTCILINNSCGFSEIYKSFDNSKTILNTSLKFERAQIYDFFPQEDGSLISHLCNYYKPIHITKSGREWTPILGPIGTIYPLKNKQFTIINNKLHYSSDYGLNWIQDTSLINSIYTLQSDYNSVLCFYDWPYGYTSIDNGLTWCKGEWPFIDFPKIYLANNGQLFKYTYDNLRDSRDTGKTWNFNEFPFWHVNLMYTNPFGETYINGSKTGTLLSGLFKANKDLTAFEQISNINLHIFIELKDHTFIGANYFTNDISISNDLGVTWKSINHLIPTKRKLLNMNVDKDEFLYISFDSSLIFRSEMPLSSTSLIKNPVHRANQGLSIFPNPIQHTLNISINPILFLENKNNYWQIIDILGKQIYTEKINSHNLSIDCTHLIEGMYLFQIPQLKLSSPFVVIK